MHAPSRFVGCLPFVLAAVVAAPVLAQARYSGPPVPLPDRPRPINNAYELLKETSLADVYLGRSQGDPRKSAHQFCQVAASVVIVFKVPKDYRIGDSPEYWSFVDREVVPEVLKACGKTLEIQLEHYVRGYRLTSDAGRHVFTDVDSFPMLYGSQRVEQPLSRAVIRTNRTPAENSFGMSTGDLLPLGAMGGSISDAVAYEAKRIAEQSLRDSVGRVRQQQRAEDVAARLRWSYQQGGGFAVSKYVTDREKEAERVLSSTNRGTVLLSTMATMLGTSQPNPESMPAAEALALVQFRNRRESAAQVLSTLSGTSNRKFGEVRMTGYSIDSIMQSVYDGQFPRAGTVVPTYDASRMTLSGVTAQLSESLTKSESWDDVYMDWLFAHYHDVYAKLCRADRSMAWVTLSYEATQATKTFGGTVVDKQTLVEGASREVRAPYEYVLQKYHPNKIKIDLGEVVGGRRRSPPTAVTADLAKFLHINGCASAVTRQFEVNLYLLTQGFPSAQTILGGTIPALAGGTTREAPLPTAGTVPATSSNARSAGATVRSDARTQSDRAAAVVNGASANGRSGPPVSAPSSTAVSTLDLSGLWTVEGEGIAPEDVLRVNIAREGTKWVGRVVENTSKWGMPAGSVLLAFQYAKSIDAFEGVTQRRPPSASCPKWPAVFTHALALGAYENGMTLSGEEQLVRVSPDSCTVVKDTVFTERVLRRVSR